jgi:hypothetical protein
MSRNQRVARFGLIDSLIDVNTLWLTSATVVATALSIAPPAALLLLREKRLSLTIAMYAPPLPS